MNWMKAGKHLLLLTLLLVTLIINSVTVALGQAANPAAAERVYLPLVTNGTTGVTPKDATDHIIVHYKDPNQVTFQTQATQMTAMSEAAGVPLDYVRALANRSVVVRLPQALTDAELQPILAKIAQLPAVALVEPDVHALPQLMPNDPRYGEQRHYFAPSVRNFGINLPGDWDITNGDPNLVVAMLDTGQLDHADLAGRMVPGYDFITDIPTANVGDGRDADPADPGDWYMIDPSSWHGTHVAGIISANGLLWEDAFNFSLQVNKVEANRIAVDKNCGRPHHPLANSCFVHRLNGRGMFLGRHALGKSGFIQAKFACIPKQWLKGEGALAVRLHGEQAVMIGPERILISCTLAGQRRHLGTGQKASEREIMENKTDLTGLNIGFRQLR